MKKFERHNFVESDKHALIGSFIEEPSVRCDLNVEMVFDKKLLEQEQVFITAGVHDKTIALAPADVLQTVVKSSTK